MLRPSRQEWVGMVLLLAGFLAFNLVSYNHYPAVWCDEVLYSEPAINLLQHGSYTTAAYEFQPPNTFPIVNCPLYGMTLVPWLAATGTSLLAVRSFNYTLMALAAFLLWNASWRFGLVRSPFARLLMLLVLHLGYGMSYCFRSCRPDMLGMVCLLLLLLAFKIERPRLRELCLVGLAAAAVWIGLQVALFAGFASFVGWLLFRRGTSGPRVETESGLCTTRAPGSSPVGLRELILLALGMSLGAGCLVLFMYRQGMLAWFLPPILGVVKGNFYSHPARHSMGATLLDYLHRTLAIYYEDFSTAALTPILLLLVTLARQRLTSFARKIVLYGLLLAFGAPALFEAVGHFPFYYSYLRYVPATLALFAAYSDLTAAGTTGPPYWFKPALALSLAGAVGLGLPLRLGLSLSCSRLVPRPEMQRMLSSLLTAQDTAFSEYLPFFEVKQIAPVAYHFYCSSVLYPTGIPGADLSPELKQAVSVLVIRPAQRDHLCSFFGGDWKAVSEPFGETQDFSRVAGLPLIGRKFASYAVQPQTERYPIQVFRRVGTPGPSVPTEPLRK